MAKNRKRDNSDSRIASLKAQDKEYNEMYRKWRIDHKHDYGFYFLDNSDELTYRDGEGFITEYPEAAERSAVTETHSLVANALVIYIAINLICTAFNFFSPVNSAHNLSYNPAGFYTGDELPAVVMTYIINILRRLIPIIYIVRKTSIPMKVLFPIKISNKPLFLMSVPMSVCIIGINLLLSKFELMFTGFFGIDGSTRIWLPDEKLPSVLYCILAVVIMPILGEFVYRGLIMQALRQFGDGYALVATSMFAAVTMGYPGTYMAKFVSSLLIGYFLIRTGSFVTAMLMRVIISASSYFMTYLESSNVLGDKYIFITFAMAAICLTVGVISLVVFMKKHSNKISLPLYEMYLSRKERFMCCVTNPSMIMWVSFAVLHVVISGGGG